MSYNVILQSRQTRSWGISKMRRSLRTSVLIVGAGPVGLALANELGYRGVAYQLIDEGDGSVLFPAGEGIFARTMEHLRRWGIATEVRNTKEFPVDQVRLIVFSTAFEGPILARFDGTSNADEQRLNPFSPEGGMFCPKKAFDPELRRGAERWDSGTICYRKRLVDFAQDDGGVRAVVEDIERGETFEIEADYLAACDGARSFVRRQLGISYVGSFAEGYNFAIYFRAPDLRKILERRFGTMPTQLHMLNVDHRPYLVAVDGQELWRMSMYIQQSETIDPAEALARILGSGIQTEVLRAQPWQGNRVVAERYRSGRTFLLGDAAHLRWPKGGFGANTGIGDAVDLGWKLDAVLSGWGGSRLLDSYELERRPIAVRNVNEASNNRHLDAQIMPDPVLDEPSQEGVEARRRINEQLFALRLREFRTAGIQLGYRYRNSPICIADGSLEPPDDHMIYYPSTWPGSRAPHAWLDANNRSTLDLFGRGFVLLQFNSLQGEDFDRAAARRSIPLQRIDIHCAKIRETYERDLVLVRPDGHVAWRGDIAPDDCKALMDHVVGW